MQFTIKRDVLLKSLTLVQGVIEKKNTLPILSNVLLDVKGGKLSIIATDLDLVFYDEINEIKNDINEMKNDIKELKNTLKELVDIMKLKNTHPPRNLN